MFAGHLYFCIISTENANFSANFAQIVLRFFLVLFCRSLAFSCEIVWHPLKSQLGYTVHDFDFSTAFGRSVCIGFKVNNAIKVGP